LLWRRVTTPGFSWRRLPVQDVISGFRCNECQCQGHGEAVGDHDGDIVGHRAIDQPQPDPYAKDRKVEPRNVRCGPCPPALEQLWQPATGGERPRDEPEQRHEPAAGRFMNCHASAIMVCRSRSGFQPSSAWIFSELATKT